MTPTKTSNVDAQRCLAAAHDMLTGSNAGGGAPGGWWPKACACLIRLALESGIDAYFDRTKLRVARCGSRRAKLLMLRRHTDGDLARRASFAWAALSRATHHHSYELAPTAAELRHLHDEVRTIVDGLAGSPEVCPAAPNGVPVPGSEAPSGWQIADK
jgi:hypothetical protein